MISIFDNNFNVISNKQTIMFMHRSSGGTGVPDPPPQDFQIDYICNVLLENTSLIYMDTLPLPMKGCKIRPMTIEQGGI